MKDPIWFCSECVLPNNSVNPNFILDDSNIDKIVSKLGTIFATKEAVVANSNEINMLKGKLVDLECKMNNTLEFFQNSISTTEKHAQLPNAVENLQIQIQENSSEGCNHSQKIEKHRVEFDLALKEI